MEAHNAIRSFMKPVEQIVLGNGAVLARDRRGDWYHSPVWKGVNLTPHRIFSLNIERLTARHGVVSHEEEC